MTVSGQVGGGLTAALVIGAFLVLGLAVFAVLLRRPAAGGRVEAELGHLTSTLSQALTAFGQVQQGVHELGQSHAELRIQVGELRSRVDVTTAGLGDKTFQAQVALQREIAQARDLVQQVRTELSERKARDEEVQKAVRHLEAVLAGAPSKGAAGENILDEAFANFPPGMVERNFRVRGKVVEYALVLGGGNRRLAIDSKWPATDAVERLATEADLQVRQKVINEVRAEIRRKVKEVAQYIDPLTTADIAIAAIPDAVYPYCGELAYDAFRQGVIVMPYSMTVPYVLNLYNLHLKYSRTVDLESLDHALSDIDRNVDSLEEILENRIQKGATMVGNAYKDVKHIAEQIKLALTYVRALPAVAGRESLGAAEAAAGDETGGGETAAGDGGGGGARGAAAGEDAVASGGGHGEDDGSLFGDR